MKVFLKSIPGGLWVASLIFIVLVGASWLSFEFWHCLKLNADTIRVIALTVGGAVAVILTLWRSTIAERQANAAQGQLETAQLSLVNERYQKSAEMLGSGVLPVRLGGIYALRRLAEEHPQEYHVQIMRLFCAFARHPTESLSTGQRPSRHNVLKAELSLDVEAVMEAIASRTKSSIQIERSADFDIDLRDAKLHGLFWGNYKDVNLYRTNVSFADLSNASFRPHTDLSFLHGVKVDLSDASLTNVNLCGGFLSCANLTDALLIDALLSHTVFDDAIVTRTDFRGARGLTQDRLDRARADPNDPPMLDGLQDAKTGKPLVWRGKPHP